MNPIPQVKENRALSSVFISDIAYDITEEILKALFSEVGQILNFRVICDKTSNKSKIAFCEYKDPEIAIRAIHSLNGYEIKGQAIHVDLATSEKCKKEIERLQGNIESIVNTPDSDQAPEEITKAVASLPAEQMFELMKQMKMCIDNNPLEGRNLLLQNPQLAYALLQAQVIMRIVDPIIAVKILSRSSTDLNAEVKKESVPVSGDETLSPYHTGMPAVTSDPIDASMTMTHLDLDSIRNSLSGPVPGIMTGSGVIPEIISGQLTGIMPEDLILPGMSEPQNISETTNQFADADLRTLGDQDLRTLGDQDLRTLPNLGDHDMRAPSVVGIDKDMRPMGDQDFRSLGVPTTVAEARPLDPRCRNMQGTDRNVIPGFDRPRTTVADPRIVQDPRNQAAASRLEDPRKASMAASINSRLSAVNSVLQSLGSNATQPSAGPTNITEEQEKASLIMQVLQLTDDQIAALPPEQRQSILVLKEQLIRSQMNP